MGSLSIEFNGSLFEIGYVKKEFEDGTLIEITVYDAIIQRFTGERFTVSLSSPEGLMAYLVKNPTDFKLKNRILSALFQKETVFPI